MFFKKNNTYSLSLLFRTKDILINLRSGKINIHLEPKFKHCDLIMAQLETAIFPDELLNVFDDEGFEDDEDFDDEDEDIFEEELDYDEEDEFGDMEEFSEDDLEDIDDFDDFDDDDDDDFDDSDEDFDDDMF
ncbi:hypothetical protein SAMN05421780_101428 [Flexibacter flexilis DSM 6793]|uniref:Uncharacterized protein n=1 Tax=Flexibacter flexilis DSM 6793 TaxID=927664 RepID=A0A1I1DYH9_9BACT|nr:hypothetical protein SAMN05421780_101428 [Flexibacter flexilis DSM 6793]